MSFSKGKQSYASGSPSPAVDPETVKEQITNDIPYYFLCGGWLLRPSLRAHRLKRNADQEGVSGELPVPKAPKAKAKGKSKAKKPAK